MNGAHRDPHVRGLKQEDHELDATLGRPWLHKKIVSKKEKKILQIN